MRQWLLVLPILGAIAAPLALLAIPGEQPELTAGGPPAPAGRPDAGAPVTGQLARRQAVSTPVAAAQPPRAGVPPRSAVRGQVFDALTRAPIPSFTVATCVDVPGKGHVRSTRQFRGPQGLFAIDDLDSPPRYVEALAHGYHELRHDTTACGLAAAGLSFALEPIRKVVLLLETPGGESLRHAQTRWLAPAGTPVPERARALLGRTRRPLSQGRLVLEDAPFCALVLEVTAAPRRRATVVVDLAALPAGEHRVPVPLPAGPASAAVLLGCVTGATEDGRPAAIRVSPEELRQALKALLPAAGDAATWPERVPRPPGASLPRLPSHVRATTREGEAVTNACVPVILPRVGLPEPTAGRPLPMADIDVPQLDLDLGVTLSTRHFVLKVAATGFTDTLEGHAACAWLVVFPQH